MGKSRARATPLPRKLLRGQKMLDGMTGEEIYQRSSSTRYQRGMYLNKKNYDTLTTEQMQEMLQNTVSGTNLSYESGQGNESPAPVIQTYSANDSYGSSNTYYG